MLRQLLFIVLTLGFLTVSAQSDRVSDFESWNKVEVKYKVKKDWSISMTEMYRLDNNAMNYKNSFTQVGISYEVKKWVSIGSVGRFTISPKNTTWRLSPVVRFSHRLKKFDLDLMYRFKPDFEWEDGSESTRIRNRFKVRHKKKKNLLWPSIGVEFFQDDKRDGIELSRIRYLAGLAIRINKKQNFEIGYKLQRAMNSKNPEDDFILALSYNYKI